MFKVSVKGRIRILIRIRILRGTSGQRIRMRIQEAQNGSYVDPEHCEIRMGCWMNLQSVNCCCYGSCHPPPPPLQMDINHLLI
jgi:hypothetical protein